MLVVNSRCVNYCEMKLSFLYWDLIYAPLSIKSIAASENVQRHSAFLNEVIPPSKSSGDFPFWDENFSGLGQNTLDNMRLLRRNYLPNCLVIILAATSRNVDSI